MKTTTLLIALTACAVGCASAPVYNAAGVLPYARHAGEVEVLLGCEPRSDRGQAQLWTDFTGGRNGMDASALDTAAREFSEETRGAYPVAEARERLDAADARLMVGDKVVLFLTEVRWIPAYAIEQKPYGISSEKRRYCWVEVGDLLARIDAAGETGIAEVPDSCGPRPRALYDLFQQNLEQGTPLRGYLESLPTE